MQIFTFSNGSWELVGQSLSGQANDDNFGSSVSLSADGSLVAIGAPNNDDNGSNSGQVRVFGYAMGAWNLLGSSFSGAAAGDHFGHAVALSSDGSTLAISAPDNSTNGTLSGEVRAYANSGDNWVALGSPIRGVAALDFSGWSISISADGSVLAVGAHQNDGNGDDAGHVRVFQYNSGSWDQVGSDITGEASQDFSGHSVALSSDGSIVAIGAHGNNGTGEKAGPVRIFENDGGTWSQVGNDIDGEAARDQSGYSVDLSADGSVVAIGAPYNSENGMNSGHARVFDISAAALPINLIEFTARLHKNQVSLYWKVATEENNAGFHIDHSTNMAAWSLVGEVNSRGNTNQQRSYTFKHPSPAIGQNFYRLRQTDYDGTATYSPTRVVNFTCDDADFALYPNPVKAEEVTVEVPARFEATGVITLYSTSGQLLLQQSAEERRLDISSLPAGTYQVRVMAGTYSRTQLLVIE